MLSNPSRISIANSKTPQIESWLRGDVSLKGSVVYERLVADHGFTGHYQRVKMHMAGVRPLIQDELFDSDEGALRGCTAGSRSSLGRRRRSTGVRRATCLRASGSPRRTRST